MKSASPLILLLFLSVLLTSCDKKAVIKVKGTGFDYNAVISIFPTVNSSKPILVKSLKSEKQEYSLRLEKSGYGRVELNSNGNRSFWIYLGEGVQEINFDIKTRFDYPVTYSSSSEGQEIINFYHLEAKALQAVKDSLQLAKETLNKSTSETVVAAANNYNHWVELKDKQHYNIVKDFSQKYPNSLFTLIVIQDDNLLAQNGKDYLQLISRLPEEVRDSFVGKQLIAQLSESLGREIGSKMAVVSGTDPQGNAFDAKILKKVNLFICWVSYDDTSRENNEALVALYKQYKDRDVEFIGVSLDKHKAWWTTVIKDDKLTWPQYSDLLHAKSPNFGRLCPQRLPYMFLTDKEGNILSQDLGVKNVELDLETYLAPKSGSIL